MQHKERRDLPVKGPPLPPRGDPKRNCSCNCNETAVAQLLRVETPGGGAAQEGVPTTQLARLDLGGDAAGERPPPSKSIHSGPRGAPKSGGSPTLTACPFLSPNPLKQTSIVQEGISRRSWLLPTRFPWASVDGVKPGLQPALSPRPPHPGEGAPLCCFISSPPPHLFLLLGCSPRPAA